MKLTEHFLFDELTVTSNEALQGQNRQEAAKFLPSLTALAEFLEILRIATGPLRVTSGFRCPALNAATPGSSLRSQHMVGQAADIQKFVQGGDTEFEVENLFDDCLAALKYTGHPFGQLILERKNQTCWVHVSLGAPWRDPARCGQVLKMVDGTYTLMETVPQNDPAS